MPHPTPMPLRRVIVQRADQGQSVSTIARSLGLVCRTVRHLLRRIKIQGKAALAASYPSRAYPHTLEFRELVDEGLELRREHPTWGAGLICVFLRRRHPKQELPSGRTLQRWFRHAALSPAPSGRRSGSQPKRAQRPHEVWQMDAADQVALRGGKLVCWLRIVDECSGAVLETAVFPPGVLEHRSCWQGANCLAPRFPTLGTAPAVSSGQRLAMGIDRRFAYRSGLVVARARCRYPF
jgi:hypothetical protein